MRTRALLVFALMTAAFSVVASPAWADTGDSSPEGGCDTCTLREAIQESNFVPGADTINFAILGNGLHTISPASELPNIVDPVTINGYTQGDSTGTTTTIAGTLNSRPRKTFTIQLFSNPSGTDEGETFLGQVQKKTNRKASFSFFGPAVPQGDEITATATGADGTSEFSDPVTVTAVS